MKLLRWLEWTAFAASVFILLRVANGDATFMYLFGVDPFEPCVIADGNFAKNGRADLVEGQARECAIIGTDVEWIGLSLADRRTSFHWSNTAMAHIRASRVCAGSTATT